MITQMKNAIAMAALTALAALSSCTKNGEPVTQTFTGDFTNLTSELVESTIGVDSALVIDKIVKDGFAGTGSNTYVNDSYGLKYIFHFENGKTIQINGNLNQSKSGTDALNFFKQANTKLMDRKLALFKGTSLIFGAGSRPETYCTKSQKEMKDYIEGNTFDEGSCQIITYYSNGTVTDMLFVLIDNSVGVSAEGKNTTLEESDTFFSEAASDCEE